MRLQVIPRILLITIFISSRFLASAQERNDVIRAYNEGAKTIQTDVPAAIKAFEEAIAIAEKVGEPANDLKEKAKNILPGLYVRVALNSLNDKKPAGETAAAARNALKVAELYGNKTARGNAIKILVQAYNAMTIDYFNKKDYENALKTTDSLLALDPDYLTAINNRALIYRAQGNSVAFEQAIDMLIEKSRAANDTARVKQASVMALEYFRAAGSQAIQANRLDEALASLNKSSKYGEDKDLFYYFADAYNRKKDFDKGEEYARKGLALETGTPEAKAKFFFQLGEAQFGKGKTAEACESYKNAMYGAFAAASKAQRTNLKCQ